MLKDTSEIKKTDAGYAILLRFEFSEPPYRIEKAVEIGDCSPEDAEEALRAIKEMIKPYV